jgi:carbon storage regulator CsrA
MLVLTRKSCESVVIGDPADGIEQSFKITVLEIGRGKVKLGFEAADHIPVNRFEVWKDIHARVSAKRELVGHSSLIAH